MWLGFGYKGDDTCKATPYWTAADVTCVLLLACCSLLVSCPPVLVAALPCLCTLVWWLCLSWNACIEMVWPLCVCCTLACSGAAGLRRLRLCVCGLGGRVCCVHACFGFFLLLLHSCIFWRCLCLPWMYVCVIWPLHLLQLCGCFQGQGAAASPVPACAVEP